MIAILFGAAIFLLVMSYLVRRRAPHASLKAFAAGIIAWIAALALFSIGKFVIGGAFIALAVFAIVLLIRKFGGGKGAS